MWSWLLLLLWCFLRVSSLSLLSTLMLPPALTHCAKTPFFVQKVRNYKNCQFEVTLRSLRPLEAAIFKSKVSQKFLEKKLYFGFSVFFHAINWSFAIPAYAKQRLDTQRETKHFQQQMHVKQVELQKTLEISREIQCYWTKNLESKLTFFPWTT